MKASLVAAAALLGGASAHNHQQRHAHDDAHHKRGACSRVVKTVTGDVIWSPTPDAQPVSPQTTSSTTTSTTIETLYSSHSVTVTETEAYATSSADAVATSSTNAIPTPAAQTLSTPGTYTFPASTVTVTATTSAVVPSTTVVSAGTYTLGGSTTVVPASTVVTAPYVTASTNTAGVVTDIIQETVYTCPVAGTYTIVTGTTTTVTAASETVTVPSITTILPGTYTAPAVTTEVVTSTIIYCPFASVGASTTASLAATSSVASVASSAGPSGVASSSVVPSVVASSSVVPSVVASSSVVSSAATESIAASSSVVVASSAASSPSVIASSVAATTAVSASTSVSASSSAASATSTSTSSTTSLGGSSPWSLTYTPYNPDTGDCMTATAVAADLAAIAAAGFTSIRIYSTDCDTLTSVGPAASEYGLKIIAGIYIGEAGCDNSSPDVEEQIAAFQAWDYMDLVELFVVANEAYNDGYCTVAELATLITHVKTELGSLYSGPWTTTDIVGSWQVTDFATTICPLIDVVAANAHAYFTSTVAPKDAGEFVQSQITIIEGACSGLTGYILESGYPTAGDTNGLAVPSVANQALAINSILETVGDRVVLFSMFDDKWKAAGAYNCEKSWGIVPTIFGSLGDEWEALADAL